jgi:hypothetical protein
MSGPHSWQAWFANSAKPLGSDTQPAPESFRSGSADPATRYPVLRRAFQQSCLATFMLQGVFQSACPPLSPFGPAKWRRQSGRAKATNMILIYPEGRVCSGECTVYAPLILRYYQCNRPVAAWPPTWPIRSCASTLERKFDRCQPSVQALKLVRITLRSGAYPRPRALGHRDPILPIHHPRDVVESLGHHRGGNCEAALYFVCRAVE